METWNERFARARKEKGLTKSAVARAVGVSQPTVTDWENGVMKPNGNNLLAVCRVLGVSPEWLTRGVANSTNALLPQGEARPPVVDESEWRALSPKARALVEEIISRASSKQLSEEDIKTLLSLADHLSSKNR